MAYLHRRIFGAIFDAVFFALGRVFKSTVIGVTARGGTHICLKPFIEPGRNNRCLPRGMFTSRPIKLLGKKLQLRQRVISNKKIRQDQLTLHSSFSIRSPQFLRFLYSFSGLANTEQYEASLNRFVLLSVTILRFTLAK